MKGCPELALPDLHFGVALSVHAAVIDEFTKLCTLFPIRWHRSNLINWLLCLWQGP